MCRPTVWLLLMVMGATTIGCGSSEPEHPPGSIPDIPPGRGSQMPGADGKKTVTPPEAPK